jgi:hypothetical protein
MLSCGMPKLLGAVFNFVVAALAAISVYAVVMSAVAGSLAVRILAIMLALVVALSAIDLPNIHEGR